MEKETSKVELGSRKWLLGLSWALSLGCKPPVFLFHTLLSDLVAIAKGPNFVVRKMLNFDFNEIPFGAFCPLVAYKNGTSFTKNNQHVSHELEDRLCFISAVQCNGLTPDFLVPMHQAGLISFTILSAGSA